jgi:hypothetical protein
MSKPLLTIKMQEQAGREEDFSIFCLMLNKIYLTYRGQSAVLFV